MKNILTNLLIFPAALCFFLCLLVYLPVDCIRYWFSPVRKDRKYKYRPFCTLSENYRLYRIILRENFPVEFLPGDPGYFLYGNILILTDHTTILTYDRNAGFWSHPVENDYLSIMPEIECIAEEFTERYPEKCLENLMIKLLIARESFVSDEDVRQAEKDPIFLLYNGKDTAQALRELIKR